IVATAKDRQAGEQVHPVGAGRRRKADVVGVAEDTVEAGRGQHHRGARDARLRYLLNAVAVLVDPDPVADRGVTDQAEVGVGSVLTWRQRRGRRVRRGRAVEIEGRGQVRTGRVDRDGEVTGRQVPERVTAVGAGHGGERRLVAGAEGATDPGPDEGDDQ